MGLDLGEVDEALCKAEENFSAWNDLANLV